MNVKILILKVAHADMKRIGEFLMELGEALRDERAMDWPDPDKTLLHAQLHWEEEDFEDE